MRYFIHESCYANDVHGYVIAGATHQPFQHSATIIPVVEDGEERLYRFEALIGSGYVCRTYHPRVRVKHVRVPLTEGEYWMLLRWHQAKVGTKYPSVAYLGLEYLVPTLRHQRRTAYCSQASIDGMVSAGLSKPVEGRPHPGIAHVVAETLALERQKRIITA